MYERPMTGFARKGFKMVDVVFNGESLGDFGALPESSQKAILSRLTGHFNNEAASARISYCRTKSLKEGEKAADIPKAELKARAEAYADANPEEMSKFVSDWFATKRKQIMEGTLGVRAGGGSADPLADLMLSMARAETKQLLGKAYPSGKGDDATVFIGSDGTRFVGTESRGALAELWLNSVDKSGRFGRPGEPNRARIERAAKRELDQKAKAAQKAVGEGETAEAIGL